MTEQLLQSDILQLAYRQGYFPMPDPETNEILWFSPDPRAVIPLDGFHVSRSLRRRLNQQSYQVTFNHCFMDVMTSCANRPDTWINQQFLDAYGEMHELGLAHSVETWQDHTLVGGVYGVHINGAFFAESKFHLATDASKVALYHLVQRLKEKSFSLLEVQFMTPHLASLGAISVSAADYRHLLRVALSRPASFP